MNLKSRLAIHLIVAQKDEDDEPDQLRILTDDASQKLCNKIYGTYIHKEDYSRYHSFLTDMDRLLARYGGQPPKIMQYPGQPAPPPNPAVKTEQPEQD
jgi:hypothetical protein